MFPAADDPATTVALSAHQAGAVRWLGGGVIAVVLGVLLGAAALTAVEGGRRIPGAGLLVIALVLLGVAAVGVGVGAWLRGNRWRRALRTTAWRTGRLRIAGPAALAFEPDGYDELADALDPGTERVLLRLLSTAVWRTRAVQRLDGAEVRAAPVGGAAWVLAADGLDTIVGARRVNGAR